MSAYNQIVKDIIDIKPYSELPYLGSTIKSMLDYTVNSGNSAIGLITIYVYKLVAKHEDKISENLRLAIILGWVMKFVSISSPILKLYKA